MSQEARELARLRWAKEKREPRQCAFCGVSFEASARQRYCSPAHQNAAAARRFRERHRSTGSAPLAGEDPKA